jgi:hypothetical protein
MKYRVYLVSAPGVGLAHYDGHVDVVAADGREAQERALRELRRTFPERRDCDWRVRRVEVRE